MDGISSRLAHGTRSTCRASALIAAASLSITKIVLIGCGASNSVSQTPVDPVVFQAVESLDTDEGAADWIDVKVAESLAEAIQELRMESLRLGAIHRKLFDEQLESIRDAVPQRDLPVDAVALRNTISEFRGEISRLSETAARLERRLVQLDSQSENAVRSFERRINRMETLATRFEEANTRLSELDALDQRIMRLSERTRSLVEDVARITAQREAAFAEARAIVRNPPPPPVHGISLIPIGSTIIDASELARARNTRIRGPFPTIDGIEYCQRTRTWTAVSSNCFAAISYSLRVSTDWAGGNWHSLNSQIPESLDVRATSAAINTGKTGCHMASIAVKTHSSITIGAGPYRGYINPPAIGHPGTMPFELPPEISLNAPQYSGFRAVSIVEQLTRLELWAFMDRPLTDETVVVNGVPQAATRVLVFNLPDGDLLTQYLYPLDMPPDVDSVDQYATYAGIVESTTLPNGRMLVAERVISDNAPDLALYLIDGSTMDIAHSAFPVLDKKRIASFRDLGVEHPERVQAFGVGRFMNDTLGGRLMLIIENPACYRDDCVGHRAYLVRIIIDP